MTPAICRSPLALVSMAFAFTLGGASAACLATCSSQKSAEVPEDRLGSPFGGDAFGMPARELRHPLFPFREEPHDAAPADRVFLDLIRVLDLVGK